MFFYIYFLRPPNAQAPPYGTISITPQVANDLRTEPFDGMQDIYFSWIQVLAPGNRPINSMNPIITKPAKLTTWRQSSAYKAIPVPLPPQVRDGQEWRLVLSSDHAGREAGCIDFALPLSQAGLVGKKAFPVMSMPILFSSRAGGRGGGGGKQEKVERVYRVPVVREGKEVVGRMKITEQTSFDLDKKIWDSGVGLSSWLAELRNTPTTDLQDELVKQLKDALFADERRNLIELGAGTGLVALIISALRSGSAIASSSASSDQAELKSNVYATDVSSAMPLLQHNITTNSHLFSGNPPISEVLDWDDEVLPEYVRDLEGGVDAIVMADVAYNTSSFPSLIRTLVNLTKMNAEATPKRNPPLIVMGYKVRDEGERGLWERAGAEGIEFVRVGERRGAGGNEVEIWIGRSR